MRKELFSQHTMRNSVNIFFICDKRAFLYIMVWMCSISLFRASRTLMLHCFPSLFAIFVLRLFINFKNHSTLLERVSSIYLHKKKYLKTLFDVEKRKERKMVQESPLLTKK